MTTFPPWQKHLGWHPHNNVSDDYPMDFEEEEEDNVFEDVMSHVRAAPPRVQALIPPVPENGLPALGTIHPMPLERSLGQLPVLNDDEFALLELHRILSKRHTRCCFDYVVGWLEQHSSSGTFNKSGELLHHPALMNRLTRKFQHPSTAWRP
jgi:hypothetical protein